MKPCFPPWLMVSTWLRTHASPGNLHRTYAVTANPSETLQCNIWGNLTFTSLKCYYTWGWHRPQPLWLACSAPSIPPGYFQQVFHCSFEFISIKNSNDSKDSQMWEISETMGINATELTKKWKKEQICLHPRTLPTTKSPGGPRREKVPAFCLLLAVTTGCSCTS